MNRGVLVVEQRRNVKLEIPSADAVGELIRFAQADVEGGGPFRNRQGHPYFEGSAMDLRYAAASEAEGIISIRSVPGGTMPS